VAVIELLAGLFWILFLLYRDRFGDVWLRLLDERDRIWLAFQQRRKSRQFSKIAGRCLKCGYDLTKNQSGICPECGTPVAEGRCEE
jgi:uncharacterized paraquat-inducible protein A